MAQDLPGFPDALDLREVTLMGLSNGRRADLKLEHRTPRPNW